MTDTGSVLVVDDDPESLRVLTGMLAGAGYRVRSARTGPMAFASARWRRPDLILLAAHLASADGFQVCRRLKRRAKIRKIPILLTCEREAVDQQAAGLQMGADDYICRPYERAEVLGRVRTQLELSDLRAASERSRAEVSVRASGGDAEREKEAWVRMAMEAGRLFAFDWNPATDEVHRSHYFCEALGVGSEGAVGTGTRWFENIHPEDREYFSRVVKFLNPVYDTYNVQYRVVRPDGRIVSLRESGRAFFDAGGKLSRLIGICADITQQKQAEAGLRQLIQKSPIAIAFVDEQGRIDDVNERFVETFGYRAEEIAEPDSWWQKAYPDELYREEVIRSWNACVEKALREDEDIQPTEYRVTCKDGTARIVEIFGALLDRRKLLFLDDITERKRAEAALRESEERFRELADTAPAGIFVFDAGGRLAFCNKYLLALIGRTPEELTGASWLDLVHSEDVDRFREHHVGSVDNRRTRQFEYRLRSVDGEYRWVLSTATPRYGADGARTGSVGILIDITEIKRRQEEMLAAQNLESLGLLASGIAHDFNNLLGCILADVDLALMELNTNSPARDCLERIALVSTRAAEMIRQIMAFGGEERSAFELVDVGRLVREMLHLLKVSIPRNGTLKVDLPADLPAVEASSAQIRQVVMNLILNAAEALGERPGVVSVAARRVSIAHNGAGVSGKLPPGDYVGLHVSDTGSGMTEETRAKIFDPFFTTRVSGRGLGLAAVKGIIRSHRGTIDVFSTPGKGTTFEILLPCADPAQEPFAEMGFGAAKGIPARTGAVLVVEDEDTLRVSVCRMLRKRGFSVLEARDGNLAIDLIRSRKDAIAVVLLDLTLPGKSSHEVFREVRRTQPGVKVIFTSAFERDSTAASLMGSRNERFIRKPYHLSELVNVLRETLLTEENAAREKRQSGAA